MKTDSLCAAWVTFHVAGINTFDRQPLMAAKSWSISDTAFQKGRDTLHYTLSTKLQQPNVNSKTIGRTSEEDKCARTKSGFEETKSGFKYICQQVNFTTCCHLLTTAIRLPGRSDSFLSHISAQQRSNFLTFEWALHRTTKGNTCLEGTWCKKITIEREPVWYVSINSHPMFPQRPRVTTEQAEMLEPCQKTMNLVRYLKRSPPMTLFVTIKRESIRTTSISETPLTAASHHPRVRTSDQMHVRSFPFILFLVYVVAYWRSVVLEVASQHSNN